MSENALKKLADLVRNWSGSLWEMTGSGVGGFRMNPQIGVNLFSSTDLAWILYAMGEQDIGGDRRAPWVRYLQSQQDARTGRFQYDPAASNHSSGHAFWHTVRALNILGGDLLFAPEYLRPVLTCSGLAAWFDAVDWSGPASNHHEVLGLVPILASRGDQEWTELFYAKLARQQDARQGTWPAGTGHVNISRTFAYTVLHLAAGRMPRMSEKIIDAILSLQRDDGLWDKGPGFLTMDAAYLLIRLPRRTGHRQADAAGALDRLYAAMTDLLEARIRTVLNNTHGMLAVVQIFALMQEAMPRRLPSEKPWRFDWDVPRMYCSKVIAGM
jgi:hypothetical protein